MRAQHKIIREESPADGQSHRAPSRQGDPASSRIGAPECASLGKLTVQARRAELETVAPAEGTELKKEGGEKSGIPQGSYHLGIPSDQLRQVVVAGAAIGEVQSNDMITDHLSAKNLNHCRLLEYAAAPLARRSALARLVVSATLHTASIRHLAYTRTSRDHQRPLRPGSNHVGNKPVPSLLGYVAWLDAGHAIEHDPPSIADADRVLVLSPEVG